MVDESIEIEVTVSLDTDQIAEQLRAVADEIESADFETRDGESADEDASDSEDPYAAAMKHDDTLKAAGDDAAQQYVFAPAATGYSLDGATVGEGEAEWSNDGKSHVSHGLFAPVGTDDAAVLADTYQTHTVAFDDLLHIDDPYEGYT